MTARYCWRITKDHVTLPQEGSNREGLEGPSNAPKTLTPDNNADVVAWRTFCDGETEPCYQGLMVGEYQGFEPLDDFATPDAGCTRIELFNTEKNQWEAL
jgi:hypothetical protein